MNPAEDRKSFVDLFMSREDFHKLYEKNNGFDENLSNFHVDDPALEQFVKSED